MDYLLGTRSVCFAFSSVNPPRVVITFYRYSNKYKHRRSPRVLITVVPSDGKNSTVSAASPSPSRVSTPEIRVVYDSFRKNHLVNEPRPNCNFAKKTPIEIVIGGGISTACYTTPFVCIVVERDSYLSSSTVIYNSIKDISLHTGSRRALCRLINISQSGVLSMILPMFFSIRILYKLSIFTISLPFKRAATRIRLSVFTKRF